MSSRPRQHTHTFLLSGYLVLCSIWLSALYVLFWVIKSVSLKNACCATSSMNVTHQLFSKLVNTRILLPLPKIFWNAQLISNELLLPKPNRNYMLNIKVMSPYNVNKNCRPNFQHRKEDQNTSENSKSTYPTSLCMASESCLGFKFSAPGRLSAADSFTTDIMLLRNSSCSKLPHSGYLSRKNLYLLLYINKLKEHFGMYLKLQDSFIK